MNFPNAQVVAIYHLPTTAGQKQPYPSSADLTTTGTLVPLDRHAHALEGGDLLDPHELYVAADVDIREGDKVVVDATTYYTKKVFKANFGRMAHKRATLSAQ